MKYLCYRAAVGREIEGLPLNFAITRKGPELYLDYILEVEEDFDYTSKGAYSRRLLSQEKKEAARLYKPFGISVDQIFKYYEVGQSSITLPEAWDTVMPEVLAEALTPFVEEVDLDECIASINTVLKEQVVSLFQR